MSIQVCNARGWLSAGVSVVPVMLDGSKRPARAWKPYMKRLPTDEELVEWFAHGGVGFGLVCGVVSSGLEVIDFDLDPDRVFWSWWSEIPLSIRSRLPVVETGGGGYHVMYRCERVCGNKKIATPRGTSKPYIETRGEGGYIIGVGSPVCVHESCKPYIQVMGPELPENIPVLTVEERKLLWQLARTFDEAETLEDEKRAAEKSLFPSQCINLDLTTPWDDFDARADWSDILQPHYWSTRDGRDWTRPGKDFGRSARVVISNKTGCEVLRVFTSSAYPFKQNKTYGKFSAFALLDHEGDRSKAAKEAIKLGYGRGYESCL
ncbi:MAG: bifunctional DNA primase/polymerase [Planctomycetota bacterium]